MIDAPCIVQTEDQLTAHIPLQVPCAEIRTVMGPGITEVFDVITKQGLTPTGAWFTHHQRRPTDSFDFSICVPIATAVKPSGRVMSGKRPAATVARTVYRGGYEGLRAAWGEFHAWIAAQGHTPRADLWECYIQGPESGADPSQWRTELNAPLTVTNEMVCAGGTYHFSRRFAAPRALVFETWTEPHHLARWWGPDGFTTPVCEFDARTGGRVRIDMRAPDGSIQELSGTVREFQAPHLLVFSCAVADGRGGVAFEVLHTVRFTEADGATTVSNETHFLQLNEAGIHRVSDMNMGWSLSLARLDATVEDLHIGTIAPELEIVSTRLFNVSPALLFRAWTEPQHLARWWGPKGFSNTFLQFEPRAGGEWRFIMHGPNGTDYPNSCVFAELLLQHRIVIDHRSAPEFRIIASFSERSDGTHLTFRMRFRDATLCANVRPIAVPSNEENFDRLEAELATMR